MKNSTFGAFSQGGICYVLPELMVAGSNLRQDTFDLLKRSYPGSGTPHYICFFRDLPVDVRLLRKLYMVSRVQLP